MTIFLFSLGNPFATLFAYIVSHNLIKNIFPWISSAGFLSTFILWLFFSFVIYLFLLKTKLKNFQKKTANQEVNVFLNVIQTAQIIYSPYFVFWLYVWFTALTAFIQTLRNPSITAGLEIGAFMMVILILYAVLASPIFILISHIIYTKKVSQVTFS